MKQFKIFNVEDVRRVNRDVIAGKANNTTGLSPAASRILRQSRFTREDINRAFAEARRLVGGI